MKRVVLTMLCSLVVLSLSVPGFAKTHAGKKVLFIDSYHEGYAWSDGITRGVRSVLDSSGVELKIIRMDTKRNKTKEFKKEAALKAKAVIDEFKPDVVIAADDNASKFLVMPYYKGAGPSFVFCGVNWDASVYGYPYKNATGMVEVTPVPQILEQLKPFAKGDRIGFLAPDILTAHKDVKNYREVFGYKIEVYFAKDFEDYKKGFVELQGKVDMLLIGSDGGLYDDKEKELLSFIESNTKIPTGATHDFMASKAFLTYGKKGEEQGEWSAQAALRILDGTSPADIPLVKNKKGTLIVNARIAKKASLEVPYEMIEAADNVIE